MKPLMRKPVLFTLLTALAVTGPFTARAQLLPGEARTILTLPEGDSPEGIAVDAEDGAVYVGNRSPFGDFITSDILKVNDDGAINLHFASLPPAPADSNGLLGLATYRGDIFAALDSDLAETQGVYKISRKGQRIERLATSENILTPNGLAFDAANSVYVTDSKTGAIWRFDPDKINQPGLLWLQHDLLTPDPANPLGLTEVGANGIVFADGSLFVANTSRNLLARIEITPGGGPGATELVAGGDFLGPLTTIDGIAVTADGSSILAAIPGFAVLSAITGGSFAPIVKVDLTTGEITPAALEDPDSPIFETPLGLALALDGSSVFVTNGALPDDDGFGVPQPGPSVVEIGIGMPGGAVAAVPEPSTALLMVLSAVALVLFHRKRRSPYVTTI